MIFKKTQPKRAKRGSIYGGYVYYLDTPIPPKRKKDE